MTSTAMTPTTATLYYVHDPMCSWCYAFRPVWQQIQAQLPESLRVRYVLGGLAADSDQPMPEATQRFIQQQWRKIEATVPDVHFNYDFWERCQPRRSTYPACRAVLLAREQGFDKEVAMIEVIQTAYYQLAQNPSDTEVLCWLAENIWLDVYDFAARLHSEETQAALKQDILLARSMGGDSFPSLFLQRSGDESFLPIPHSYTDAQVTLEALRTQGVF